MPSRPEPTVRGIEYLHVEVKLGMNNNNDGKHGRRAREGEKSQPGGPKNIPPTSRADCLSLDISGKLNNVNRSGCLSNARKTKKKKKRSMAAEGWGIILEALGLKRQATIIARKPASQRVAVSLPCPEASPIRPAQCEIPE